MSGYIMDLRKLVRHRPLLQVGASVIVEDRQGRILLQLRCDNHCWGYAGGSVELDEVVEEAAKRELFEETHQKNSNLEFRGLFKIMKPDGEIKYQAIFLCFQDELVPYEKCDGDEMDEIMLWDLKEDIGYVDECDLKMVELSCV